MNKTIYVSEDDLPLFEEAQKLFRGNLSAVIAHALRLFVESRTREGDFKNVTLVVGGPEDRRSERFAGRHIADWRHLDSQGTALVFSVYRTRRHRWALYRRRTPLTPAEQALYGQQPGTWIQDSPRLDVFDNLDDLKKVIPQELQVLVETDPQELPLIERDI